MNEYWIVNENKTIGRTNSYKLKNFPPVHFISIIDSEERRKLLFDKFLENNITNVTQHVFKRYEEGDYVLNGQLIDKIVGSGRGPLTSHLRAIKSWYYGTDEPYALFCEDDLSLETVRYWNFTWEEFFNELPKDWECVQLCWVREQDSMFRFLIEIRERCWCDWSACCYLIKRSYAKKLISHYYRDEEFVLDYAGIDKNERPEWALVPNAENIIFSKFNIVYGFPLFCEDIRNLDSSIKDSKDKYNNRHWNIYSYDTIIEWWHNTGKNLTLFDLTSSLRRMGKV